MTGLRLRDDSGFTMIEAIVSCLLLVIVSLGVLKGLDTANRSSGREKGRAVAAALTEQDQERLRAFRAVDLADYDETRTVIVNKAPYTIVSRGDWVRDSTGGTASCNNTGVEADYMRVTTTTTSGLINSPIPPITMSSLVAPPAGAFGINQGTLGVQINNRDGEGVAGVPVTISGPASDTNTTNAAGCAIFASIPVGSYTASVTQAGKVDHSGDTTGTVLGTVTNGTVSVATLEYDSAASVAVTFDTEPLSGLPASVVAYGTQLSAVQRQGARGHVRGPPHLRRCPAAPGSPGSPPPTCSRSPTATASSAAAARAPTRPSTSPTTTPTSRTRSFRPSPGMVSPPAVVRLPSINLRVTHGGIAPALRYTTAKILITSKSADCTETFRYSTGAIDALGWMQNSALPFGDYEICVSMQRASPSTSYRKVTIDDQRQEPPSAGPQAWGDPRGQCEPRDRRPQQQHRREQRRMLLSPHPLPGRRHARRADRRDGDRRDHAAGRVRRARHLREAVERRRGPRQRDTARSPRDGHDHAPAALADLHQRDARRRSSPAPRIP